MSRSPSASSVAPVLVDNHRRFLAFLERRVRSREIAEDILQDAFVRGIAKAPPLASAESVVAWFYQVLRNAVVDHHRRTGARTRALDRFAREYAATASGPEDAELMATVCECVRSLVPTLKPEYAAAIARVDLDGVPLPAYAAEQGITANNAGVRLHRAHRALKRRVQETCETCADHGCVQCECLATRMQAAQSRAAAPSRAAL
jgi:RNA polymerase sigma-70 factor (ECF subfamily)